MRKMNGIVVTFAILAFTAAAPAEEYANTESGQRVLLRDNGTWIVAPPPMPQGTTNAEQVLKAKCRGEWPRDFQMQAYCEGQQRQAVSTLERGKPVDIPANQFSIIRNKCTNEWPDDFKMREYCEGKQYEAIRKLR